MRTLRGLTLLFGGLFLGSCGDDGNDSVTRSEFCESWASAACSEETTAACQAESVDNCRVAQQQFCLDQVPEEFSGENTGACLQAVSQAYQDADLTAEELSIVLRFEGPCQRALRGPQLEGESCLLDLDCDGPAGQVCVVKGGEPNGTCQVPEEVAAGLACDQPQQQCAEGFFCNGDNCIVSRELGELCSTESECGMQAFCGPDSTCLARFPVDMPCTEDVQCLSDVCFTFGPADQTCVDLLRLSRSEPLCDQLR